MTWKKSPPRLIEAFDGALPRDPRVERRAMFGCPCAFVNRNMFAGLHQDTLFIRLGQDQRARLRTLRDARPFEPMPGRVMREYVVVPEAVVATPRGLTSIVGEAFRYAAALPAKRPRAARAARPRPERPRRSRAQRS